MSSVDLDRVWLHDAEDLSSYRTWFSIDRADTRAVHGEVRTYANGRRRVVSRVGRGQDLPVTLRLATLEDVDWLDDRMGALMMLRDERGLLVFGSFFAVAPKAHKGDRGLYDVALSLALVTFDIEV